MYKMYIDKIKNLIIYLNRNLDRIAAKYYILINKTYLHGYHKEKVFSSVFYTEFHKVSG